MCASPPQILKYQFVNLDLIINTYVDGDIDDRSDADNVDDSDERQPISERVTSEYWPAANANDAVRGKNNGNRLTDVDHQDHCGEVDQQHLL